MAFEETFTLNKNIENCQVGPQLYWYFIVRCLKDIKEKDLCRMITKSFNKKERINGRKSFSGFKLPILLWICTADLLSVLRKTLLVFVE